VGKTLLTALLLYHLRKKGRRALAMKPFCSGDRNDVQLLQSLQEGELPDDEVNPFYFKEPIAPFVAARKHRRTIRLADVIEKIKQVEEKCDCLLIEGSGGLFVPLGTGGFMVADVISKLDCRVLVAARNQLGTINHTLLTMNALRIGEIARNGTTVVLMSGSKPDISALDNEKVLVEFLAPVKVLSIPFLGKQATRPGALPRNYSKAKNALVDLEKAGA
jgi:dethiobiotin synthetase